MSLSSQWKAFFRGNEIAAPSGGNRDNAPASPPVQTGPYQWIQYQMYPDMSVADVPPPNEWAPQMVLPEFGYSGLTGGGMVNDPLTGSGNMQAEPLLYYDSQTGTYIDLGLLNG